MIRILPFLRHLFYFPVLLGFTGTIACLLSFPAQAAPNTVSRLPAATPVIEIASEPSQFLAAQGEEQTQFYVIYFNDFPPGQSGFISVLDPSGSFTISTQETTGFGATLEIKPNGDGSLDAVTVYIRYQPTDDQYHLASLSHSSTGAETQTFSVEGYPPLVPLPVQLVFFKASRQSSSVVFDWRAAPDEDLSHFELEASSDPQQGFHTIGTLACLPQHALAETDYHYVYQPPTKNPTMYYRLAQVYLNNAPLYSKIVVVEMPPVLKTSILAYPTPFLTTLQLHVAAREDAFLKVVVHTLHGEEVLSQTYRVLSGENEIALDTTRVYARGIYLLTAALSGSVYTCKVVKL
ncbi:T9SS type A sorting domain-containing protein [Pontibacter liquoris]|uniref:T9SS type A sorting domain-containing protein n=1 Tax=Pontibacter liquoris TaxID=2905677 RepID=UPI001FA764EC|nr:T9SS type A sorting domain-containing protein [Pontibacter liquoris]